MWHDSDCVSNEGNFTCRIKYLPSVSLPLLSPKHGPLGGESDSPELPEGLTTCMEVRIRLRLQIHVTGFGKLSKKIQVLCGMLNTIP